MSIIRKEQLTNPLSASYALTASYAENASSTSVNTGSLLTTASVNLNTITFTKGNGSTFPITVNTGSGGTVDTSGLVTTSSFNAFTSSINTFTSSYNTGSFSGSFTGSFNGTASWAQYVVNGTNIDTSSFATTGSNSFNGNQSITGRLSTTEFFTTTINDTSLEDFSSASNYAGTVLSRASVDGNVVPYDLVYLENDGVWYQNDQSTSNSSKKLGICVDIDNRLVLIEGHIVVGVDFTVQAAEIGAPIFIRENGGIAMSCNPPTMGYVRILGHIYYQNQSDNSLYIMRFNPSNDFYLLG